MKALNYLCLAILAVSLAACEANIPTQPEATITKEQLLGVWYSPNMQSSLIRSFVFTEGGVLEMRYSDEGLGSPMIKHIETNRFYYSIQDGKLVVIQKDTKGNSSEIILSSCFVKEDTLCCEDFPYNVSDGTSIRYVRAQKIPSATLEEGAVTKLNDIFTASNERVWNNVDYFQPGIRDLSIVKSQSELKGLCPQGKSSPELDFTKQCIVYGIVPDVAADEWKADLFCTQEKQLFELIVDAQKQKDNTTCVYGVFDISPNQIALIKDRTQVIFR